MRIKIAMTAFVMILSVTSVYAQLSIGNVEITTKLKEKFIDKKGDILTGKGVLVGDVDSGIDVFHPFFFFADGGDFDWIDNDENGKFDAGEDAVDFNKNGKSESSEILNVLKMQDNTYGLLGPEKASFEADMDFLYTDVNKNKKRDFGLNSGFTEQTPSFGEQLFIVRDLNKNNKLDDGEKISALKTSKVKAVREKDGTIRRRGIDLIKTEPDTIEHGTHVASIVMGGHYGVQRIHGIAPDAEMVFANIDYDYTPRFVKNFPDMLNFLKDEGINIMLIEDGEFSWEFMDGSTPEEEILNQMARDGITVIGGGGNLASANAHTKEDLKANVESVYVIEAPENSEGKKNDGFFPTFLWKQDQGNVAFRVVTPDGKKTGIITEGGKTTLGAYNVYSEKEVSHKGTVMMRFLMSRTDSGAVDGEWTITAISDKDLTLDGFIVDVSQSWSGTTHFKNKTTDEGTVTFPTTADSCISVGAYVVNFGFFQGDEIGNLCSYSGRGYNITGKMGIDITAPGHTTFAAAPDNRYDLFSGTSSAAPHVVGAAALLLQLDPSLTHSQIRNILNSSAKSDKFTGNTPNTNWGHGKLDIESAIKSYRIP